MSLTIQILLEADWAYLMHWGRFIRGFVRPSVGRSCKIQWKLDVINKSKIEKAKQSMLWIIPSCNHFIKHEDASLALWAFLLIIFLALLYNRGQLKVPGHSPELIKSITTLLRNEPL